MAAGPWRLLFPLLAAVGLVGTEERSDMSRRVVNGPKGWRRARLSQ